MLDQKPLHLFMLYYPVTFFVLQGVDPVMLLMLNHCFMEKSDIPFSFPQPVDSEFLFPQNLLLLYPFLKLIDYVSFFQHKALRSTMLDDLLLYFLDFVVQLVLVPHDVVEIFSIPFLDLVLNLL